MKAKKLLGKYPYLLLDSKLTSKLSNFALKLNSSTNLVFPSTQKVGLELIGFTKGYQVFLELFSSENFEELEGMLESNLVYRLKASWNGLKELGYSMRLIGDPESTRAFSITKDYYIGSLIPFRNLNLPSEYYDFSIQSYETSTVNSISKIFLKDMKYEGLNFENLGEIDLDKIDQEGSQSNYKVQIMKILSLMRIYHISCMCVDVGIASNYKIVIQDKDGNIVAGKDDSSEEFHCVRYEIFSEFLGFWQRFTKEGKLARAFYNNQFEGFMHEYTIIDVDGFMDKNLLIPK